MVLLTAMHTAANLEPSASPALDRVPLVVDLDDTLLRTDSLIESIFVLARTKPLSLFKLPAWWIKGAAYFKRRLADAAMPDVHLLPYRSDLLAYLREQKGLGRPLILATAADEQLARFIDRDVGLFDEILASDGHTNLNGERKRDRLIAEFGLRGFDYIGNRASDFPVWRAARRAILVSASARLNEKGGQESRRSRGSFANPALDGSTICMLCALITGSRIVSCSCLWHWCIGSLTPNCWRGRRWHSWRSASVRRAFIFITICLTCPPTGVIRKSGNGGLRPAGSGSHTRS